VPTVWRFVKTRYAATAFDGEGAREYGGRWNSPGTRVAYASGSVSLAMLEVLVHLNASQLMTTYSVVSARIPDALVKVFPVDDLPKNWKSSPAPAESAAIGDAWVSAGTTAVLALPSVIVETEMNYLINPAHPDFKRITLGIPRAYPFDRRLRR
jgi:RES domain-containing protein